MTVQTGQGPKPDWCLFCLVPFPAFRLASQLVFRLEYGHEEQHKRLLLDRILEPISSSLNVEAAQKLLALKADRKMQTRVTNLADKCNDGELTSEERHEYEIYLMVNYFIAILKAKVRILFARKGQSA